MELQSAGNRNSIMDPQRLKVKYLNSIVETYSTEEDKEIVHTKYRLNGKSKGDNIIVNKKTRLTKAERLNYKMSGNLGQYKLA